MMMRLLISLFVVTTVFAKSEQLVALSDGIHPAPVFRDRLSPYHKSIIAKLGESLWVAYDANSGELVRVWTPQADGIALKHTGILSDGTHGKGGSNGASPSVKGQLILDLPPEQVEGGWQLNGNNLDLELEEILSVDGEWSLKWRFLDQEDTWQDIAESIELDPATNKISRTFTYQGSSSLTYTIPSGATELWGESHVTLKNQLTLTSQALTLPDLTASYVGVRPGIESGWRLGTPRPTNADKKVGGFGEKLRSLHPGYNLTDLSKLFLRPFRIAGMGVLSNGDLLVATWEVNGAVYRITNPDAPSIDQMQVSLYAHGLQEPCGLLVHEDRVYVAQKHEVSELVDRDGDGFAELQTNLCDSFGSGMNFHQFTFGPVYYQDQLVVALSVNVLAGGATGKNIEQDRGCVIGINPETHKYKVIAAGMRTPNGIGHGPDESLLVLDNQGDWKPGNPILEIKDGGFYDHRYEPLHPLAQQPSTPPAIWLPQGIIGNSLSDPIVLSEGTYKNQILFGDVCHGGIKRASFERLNGELQGAVMRHSGGIRGGMNRIRRSAKGNLFVGIIGSQGNWWDGGATGGIQRLTPNGKPVFEIESVRLKANGFQINLSEPVAEQSGWRLSNYKARHYWYLPTQQYGGPLKDVTDITPKSVSVSADGKSLFLELPTVLENKIYELHLSPDLVSAAGRKLWTGDVFYTVRHLVADKGESRPAPAHLATAQTQVDAQQSHPMESVYQSLCIGCHQFDGAGELGPSFADLHKKERVVIRDGNEVTQGFSKQYLMNSLKNPTADLVKGYQPTMPNLLPAIGDQNVEALVDYLIERSKGH